MGWAERSFEGENGLTDYTSLKVRRLILARGAPIDMHVGGDLDLAGTAIAALPGGLRVDGDTNLTGITIVALPCGLRVGGDIFLR